MDIKGCALGRARVRVVGTEGAWGSRWVLWGAQTQRGCTGRGVKDVRSRANRQGGCTVGGPRCTEGACVGVVTEEPG